MTALDLSGDSLIVSVLGEAPARRVVGSLAASPRQG